MKTYKIELKFNKEQMEKHKLNSENCRWLFNKFITIAKLLYKHKWKTLHYSLFNRYSTHFLEKQNKDLFKTPSKSRQDAVIRAYKAYKKFMKNSSKFPRIKDKNSNVSVTYATSWSINWIKKDKWFNIQWNKIRLPLLWFVKMKETDYVPIGCMHCIVFEKWGRIYWSFSKKEEIAKNVWWEILWWDLWLWNLLTLSNWVSFPKIEDRFWEKIKKLQKDLRKKEKGSNWYFKTLKKLRNLRRKKFNYEESVMNSYIKEMTKMNIKELKLEDINIEELRKGYFSKSFHNACWGRFIKKLETKFNVLYVDKYFPSTKMCSECKSVNEKFSVFERTFTCSNCWFKCDRDLNASFNLRDFEINKF